ncbi:MAG: pitrilysin family protein, partial [Thermaerobacterales bacterium]
MVSTSMGLPGAREIHRRTLDNGLTVLFLPRPDLPFVVMRVENGAGSARDPRGSEGLAALTATAMTRGTERLPASELFQMTDSYGIGLTADADSDTAQVGVRALHEDFSRGLDLLAEVVISPGFEGDEVAKLRDQIISRLYEVEDDTGYRAERALAEELYPDGHPYRHPVSGYPSNLAALSREAVQDFHRRHYFPAEMRLAVVGDLETA